VQRFYIKLSTQLLSLCRPNKYAIEYPLVTCLPLSELNFADPKLPIFELRQLALLYSSSRRDGHWVLDDENEHLKDP